MDGSRPTRADLPRTTPAPLAGDHCRALWIEVFLRGIKDALDGNDPTWPLSPDAATVASLAGIDPTAFRDRWRAGRVNRPQPASGYNRL